jgi:hypothetical protein
VGTFDSHDFCKGLPMINVLTIVALVGEFKTSLGKIESFLL